MRTRRFALTAALTGLSLLSIAGLELKRPALAEAVIQKPAPMFVTVRRYEGVPDPQKAARVVSDTWIPIISKLPGFIAYYWVDAGNGVMVSTSIFKTREGAEASNTKVKQWRLSNPEAASALPKAAQITAGEVVGYKAK
jgi:hypothetical protein